MEILEIIEKYIVDNRRDFLEGIISEITESDSRLILDESDFVFEGVDVSSCGDDKEYIAIFTGTAWSRDYTYTCDGLMEFDKDSHVSLSITVMYDNEKVYYLLPKKEDGRVDVEMIMSNTDSDPLGDW